MKISNDQPRRVTDSILSFEAEDDAGSCELWVPVTMWETLQADAPLPSDGDDPLDYALSMIEATAAGSEPGTAHSGLRVLLL